MPRRGGGGRRGVDSRRDQPSSKTNQSADHRRGSGSGSGSDSGTIRSSAGGDVKQPSQSVVVAASKEPSTAAVLRSEPSSSRPRTSTYPAEMDSLTREVEKTTLQSADHRGGTGSDSGTIRSSAGGAVKQPSQSVVVAASKEPSTAAGLRSDPSSSRPRTSIDPAQIDLLTRQVEKTTLQPAPPPPVSSKALSLPRRPGYGTVGKKIVVRANHFLVEVSDKDIHHYDVSIKPEITSKNVCRTIIKELENVYKESHLNKRMLAYDGSKSLYTAGALPFQSKELVVALPDNRSQTSTSTRRERQFTVTINFASRPDIHHLQEFLRGRQLDVPQEAIQMLDVVLRTTPSADYTVVGRSFFSLQLGPKGELGDGVEYWKGYYQSLRPTQMGLSLNIDISARSFYEQILVTDFVAKYINLRDFSRPLSDQERLKIKKALRGIKVRITYSEHGRTYKVTGISAQSISQLGFSLGDDTKKTSILQYFRERYGIALKYYTLPALQAGNDPSNPIYLPMELCEIVGGQRYTKKLNERQVTALLRATCQRPLQREDGIKKIVQNNNYGEDKLVNKEFGIKVREDLTSIDARVLPSPMLKYHDTGKETRVDPKMGQWNMINKKMVNGGKVEWWTCVNFSSRINRNVPFDFCEQLIAMCNSKGMDFNPSPLIPITSAQPSQIEKTLGEVNKKSQERLKNLKRDGDRLQLLIIILPDFSGSYGKIKRVCETELGIVSQCCQPKQASRMSIQYFENVALKINVKVGGRNSVLNDAILRKIPFVSDMPTIIFGADVTHPAPGEDSSPSIAAVVASMDWPEVTKYKGLISSQSHREEIIQDLYKLVRDPQRGLVHGGMIKELLVSFFKSTGLKPKRIIFYRDGVSEGQFNQVLLYEMDAIRKACVALEEGYLPPVTFIVVQKRHHTRLFPADNRNLDRSGNILPGTVVDTKICHPMEFDFYLNSHAGIQGTSRPAHYHVLYDENKFTADSLQLLTNNLCYTYARCTKSVSLVPPAYYAHLAAFRARYYIEGEFSESGSTSEGRSGEVRPLPVVKENVKEVMFYC